MGIVRCCWKRWWMRPVFAEPAIGRPTGSMLGKPPDAAAWTESTKAHGQAIKDIYLYPLVRDARQHLCGDLTR